VLKLDKEGWKTLVDSAMIIGTVEGAKNPLILSKSLGNSEYGFNKSFVGPTYLENICRCITRMPRGGSKAEDDRPTIDHRPSVCSLSGCSPSGLCSVVRRPPLRRALLLMREVHVIHQALVHPPRASTPPASHRTGRLAAMVLGGLDVERVALNHEWLWRGAHRNRDTEPRAHLLPEVRQLLLSGQYAEGTLKANQAFGGLGGVSKQPHRVDPYQPAGDLRFTLDHGAATEYRRALDLERGLVTVDYAADGARFRRDTWHIWPRSAPGAYHRRPAFLWPILARSDCRPGVLLVARGGTRRADLDGLFHGGIAFRVEARLHAVGGKVAVADEALTVSGATEVIVSVNIGTSAGTEIPRAECARYRLPHTEWERLLAEHIAIYRSSTPGCRWRSICRSRRCPQTNGWPQPVLAQPTRASRCSTSISGRYLIVASAATGDLPPNLQGKWNESLRPPWDARLPPRRQYPDELLAGRAGKLAFATESFLRHCERFRTARPQSRTRPLWLRRVYFPLQTDPWGRSTPESFGWAVWIGAGRLVGAAFLVGYEFGRI